MQANQFGAFGVRWAEVLFREVGFRIVSESGTIRSFELAKTQKSRVVGTSAAAFHALLSSGLPWQCQRGIAPEAIQHVKNVAWIRKAVHGEVSGR